MLSDEEWHEELRIVQIDPVDNGHMSISRLEKDRQDRVQELMVLKAQVDTIARCLSFYGSPDSEAPSDAIDRLLQERDGEIAKLQERAERFARLEQECNDRETSDHETIADLAERLAASRRDLKQATEDHRITTRRAMSAEAEAERLQSECDMFERDVAAWKEAYRNMQEQRNALTQKVARLLKSSGSHRESRGGEA